jgi:phenylacetyl-CoA:acceptor oxidoreductase subunit 2
MHEEIGTKPGFHYVYGRANKPAQSGGPATVLSTAARNLRTRGVEPWHQQHWDWKAAGNFICGGAGAGLFVFVAIASLRYDSVLPFGWPALGLIALGLFLVLLKIGRPWRFIYVLRQPQRSWMTREAWIAAVFFPVAALAMWLEARVLMVPAAILDLLFLYSQAMILKEAKGIPAWRTPFIVPLMMTTGVTEGGGLFLAAIALLPSLGPMVEKTAVVAIILAAIRGWTWRSYVTALTIEGAPTRALDVLDTFGIWFLIFGLAVPVALIALGFVASNAASILFALSGLCICAAGGALKFVLVTRAGWNQGFALTHTPLRGSGTAGLAVKPGWSLP